MSQEVFLVDINLTNNQLLNAIMQNLSAHPSTTNLPQAFIYWNTTVKTLYIWTGSASTPNTDNGWLDLGSLYTHPVFPGTGQPGTALTGAQVISQITLNNGHTTGVVTRNLTAADIGAAGSSHVHNFTEVVGLPAGTILGNNTGATAAAQALTVAEVLTMLGIAYGTAPILTTGTDTAQRTWSAKMLTDWVNSKLNGYITAVNLALGTRTATDMPITNSAGTGVTLPSATTALAGLLSAADKTKLDGIAAGANNYVHPTFTVSNPFQTEVTSGLQVLSQLVVNNEGHTIQVKGRNITAADIAAVLFNDAINNGTVQTWSSSKIYSEIQNAIGQVTTGALQYKGDYNPVTNAPNVQIPATGVKTGWTYVISADGTFLGEGVEIGDMIIAKVDNPGSTRANWQIVNKNIPAIVSATATVEGIIFLATQAEAIAGTNATKAITPATLKAVLDARVGGFAANIGDGTAISFVVTHGLGTQDVTIRLVRVSDNVTVHAATASPSTTTVTVNFNTAPTTNQYRVIIKK